MAEILSTVIPTKGDNSKDKYINNLIDFFGKVEIVTDDEGASMASKLNIGVKKILESSTEENDNDWIVFCHDDITPISTLEALKKSLDEVSNVADAVFIAGTTQVPPVSPGHWFHNIGTPNFRGSGCVTHWLQYPPNVEAPEIKQKAVSMYGPYPARIAAGDGLFFAAKRSVFSKDKIFFDEETFNAYHFYDADFCAQLRMANKQMWTIDFMALHESPGNSMMQGSFILAQQAFVKKYFKKQKLYNQF